MSQPEPLLDHREPLPGPPLGPLSIRRVLRKGLLARLLASEALLLALGAVYLGWGTDLAGQQALKFALVVAALLALFGVVLFWSLSELLDRRLVRPMEALSQANARLRDGNLDGLEVEFPPDTPAELQETALTRRRFLTQLHEAKNQAEQANRAKSQFLAHMSHEIRTPLNAMVGMTDLTLQTPLNSEQKENLLTIKESASHLLSLVNDILDYSKIEAGRVELAAVDFDLRELMEGLRRTLSVAASRKGLEVELIWDSQLPTCFQGDPMRLRQVLMNLADNAIKFTDSGRVSLVVRGEGDPTPDQDRVGLHFAVLDTGIGVPEDKQKTIFEHFTQADDSTTRRFGGAGLGLSIAWQVVTLMGGELSLESQEGRGSRFFFTLALPRGDQSRIPTAAPAWPAQKQPGRPLRVLVAEDHSVNAQVAGRLLTRLGHQFQVAGNGRQALEMVAAEPFDLVLMDLEMPVMDGLEATRRLRQGEAGEDKRDLPVVAMTAHAQSEARQSGLDAGMNHYLVKPIDFNVLGQLLAGMFPGQKPEEAAPAPEAEAEPDKCPLMDRDAALTRLGGDQNLLSEMHRLFLREIPSYKERLATAVDSGEFKEIVMQAHTLKGTAATVGAEAVRMSALNLEQLGRAGRKDSLAAALSQVEEQLERTAQHLRDTLDS